MPESVTHVIYEALADFSSLHAAAAGAIADLDAIKRKEAEVNAASASGAAQDAATQEKKSKGWKDYLAAILGTDKASKDLSTTTKDLSSAEKTLSTSTDDVTKKTKAAKVAFEDLTKTKTEAQKATKDLGKDVGDLGKAVLNGVKGLFSHKAALDENTKSTSSFRSALRTTLSDLKTAQPITSLAAAGFDKLNKAIAGVATSGNGRGGAWPFALLAPLIIGILALVGPLVAGISSVGAAALGLVANLSTLSGVFLALPSAMGAYATSLEVVRIAFQGIGSALSAYNTMMAGPTKANTQAYQKALENLSPAQVTFVQWLQTMQGAWNDFQDSLRQNFFSAFSQQLGGVNALFQILAGVMDKAAAAVGGVVSQFLKLLETPGAQKGLDLFGAQNAELITTIGNGLVVVLDMIGKITVAAGPFAQEIASGLVSAATALDTIVSKASSDGSLAHWLATVYSNLRLWWGIVSDLAKTIFNYGSAAQGFGLWITKGLKDVTDGWLKASEAALKPGSNFQTWLGNVKPLVTELASIIGNLLSWWNQTSTNKNNINEMLTILKDINDHLGPALGDLLNTMAKTHIGPDLVHFLITLVQLIDSLMSHGGAQVVDSVIHFLTMLGSFLASVMAIPGVATTLMTVAVALTTISALTFVNKFIPLIDAIAWLLRLADAEGPLTKIFNAWSGYKAPAEKLAQKTTTDNGTEIITGSGKSAKKKTGTVEDSPSSQQIKDEIGVVSGEGDAAAGESGGLLGKILGGAGKFVGFGLKGLGGALGAAYLGSMLYGAATDKSKPVKNFNAGTGNSWAGVGLGAGSGALAGAGFGPLDPLTVPIGAGVGAASATTGANGRNVLTNIMDPKQWQIGAKQIVDALSTANDAVGKFFKGVQKGFGDFFSGLGKQLGIGAKQISDFFTKTLPALPAVAKLDLWKSLVSASKWLQQQSTLFQKWFTFDLPFSISKNASDLWKSLKDANTWTTVQEVLLANWFGKLPVEVTLWVGDVWKNLKDANAWTIVQEGLLANWFGKLPVEVTLWVGDVWKNLTSADSWTTVQNAKLAIWFGSLAGSFGKWAGDVWKNLKDANAWTIVQEGLLANWFGKLPVEVTLWVGDVWKNVTGVGGWIAKQTATLTAWLKNIPMMLAGALVKGWDAGASGTPSSGSNGSGHGSGGGHFGSARAQFQAPAGFPSATPSLNPLPSSYKEPDTSGTILKVANAIDTETKARDALIRKKKEQQDQDKAALKNDADNLTWQQKVAQGLQKHIDAVQALKDAVKTTADAQVQAQGVMDKALETNGKHWDDGTLAADKNKLAVINYSVASTHAADALRATGGSYDDYKAKLEESRKKIVDTITALGGNKDAAIQVADSLVKIPTQRQFTLLNNLDAVKAQADAFYKLWSGRTFSANFMLHYSLPNVHIPDMIAPGSGGGTLGPLGGAIGGLVNNAAQYLATGGPVRTLSDPRYNMDPFGTDTQAAMLTPGEYVVKKERVDQVGASRMQAFNDGLLGLADLVGKSKDDKGSLPSFLSGSGLVGYNSSMSRGFNSPSSSLYNSNSSSVANHAGTTIGQIVVNNPKPEPTSESLPRTLRKVSYLTLARGR